LMPAPKQKFRKKRAEMGLRDEKTTLLDTEHTRGSHLVDDVYPLRPGSDAIGKANLPALFALVHSQNYTSHSGRVVSRQVEQKKTRSQLGHRNGIAVENEVDPDVGGMAALAARL